MSEYINKYEGMENFSDNLKLDGVKFEEVCKLHPSLFEMLGFCVSWGAKNNCNIVLTSVYRSPKYNASIGAKSRTHQEFRAFDLSSAPNNGWNFNKIEQFKKDIESKFKSVGAIHAVSGESRPIVYHDIGLGEHFHLQVRP